MEKQKTEQKNIAVALNAIPSLRISTRVFSTTDREEHAVIIPIDIRFMYAEDFFKTGNKSD